MTIVYALADVFLIVHREKMNTPTSSELATFEVLANRDFVNMNRPVPGGEPDDELGLDNFEEEFEDDFSEPPQAEVRVQADAPDVRESRDAPDIRTDARPDVRPDIRPERPDVRTEEPSKKYDTKSEIEAEKEALLSELNNMEKQGIKLVRPLTMNDSLEEIQFQYDRMMSEQTAVQMIDIAKQGIKMGSGVVEMTLKKAGVQVVDGYHKNLCADMGKFNRPLGRLYKKYWRRGGMSPEMELGMIVFGSLAWTIVQNKMSGMNVFSNEPEKEKEEPKPAPKPFNIPPSWNDDKTDEVAKAKEAFEAKERQLANALAASEARERALQTQLQTKEETKEEPELPHKRVLINVATPVKSSTKKKSVALNLDD